jgi:hypothetical protein
MAAIVDGIRLQAGSTALSGSSQFLPALYAVGSSSSAYSGAFLDITSGSNGYGAGAGYDFATGLGSPSAAGLVASLAGVTGSGSAVKIGPTLAASPKIQAAIVTPHDIPVTIVTIINLPIPGAPSNSPIQTPSPTPSPSPPLTQPVLVTIVSLTPTGAVSSSAIVVVFAPFNPAALATTASPAVHSTAGIGVESGLPGVTVLTAAPSTAIRPPQPLDVHPAFDRDLLLRLHDEDDPFAPLDYKSPAGDWDLVARGRVLDVLDLLAIAQQALALGRVAARDEPGAAPTVSPAATRLSTDLNQRAASPPFDPALAAIVVAVSGSLAVKTGRSTAKRRSWLPLASRR